MRILKHVIGCLAGVWLLAACQGLMKSDTGRLAELPSIVDLSCEPGTASAVLTASTKEPAGISECGFYWFEAGISSKVVAQMDDRGLFSATIDFLNPGTEYVYCAYVSNGVSELRSMKKSFSTKKNDTPDEPDQPDNPDTPDEPDEPETPDEPEQPDNPDMPDTPDEPDEPEDPDDIINIPDPEFKAWMLWNFDINGDGELSGKEALEITIIQLNTDAVQSLQGIEHCPNLEYLSIRGGSTEGDLPGLGRLSSLDVSHNPKLWHLNIENNAINSIDLTHNPELLYIGIYKGGLNSIDLSQNKKATLIGLGYNQLTSIDLSGCISVEEVHVDHNNLNSCELGKLDKLSSLDCCSNSLSSLDISQCRKLNLLDCRENEIPFYLYMKTGQVLGSLVHSEGLKITYKD